MRYRLDDLGWYHFEALVQSAMKAEYGILVESWGGSSDLGRDAYCADDVRSRSSVLPGPVVFQAKFVTNANASGATWEKALRHGILAEVRAIRTRLAQGVWIQPSSYVLLTNAPITATFRSKFGAFLQGVTGAHVHLLGGTDICGVLDNHADLRRSFPELLSLRDLNTLLDEAVHRDILQRSAAAIEETRDLVPVFVPTEAYDQTWAVLEAHSVAVLDGPPEMGKTAIARTVAFSHLLSGWEVIDCRTPDDLFASFDSSKRQVFVADDAFGRTEFDPTLARLWERDLPRILWRVGPNHRLLLTTRKHILQRALREMDLTGKARTFPDASEILVTAESLSAEEKARILYRHGKTIAPTTEGRGLVQKMAKAIVNDKHFTPERIRRLVAEVIPEIESRGSLSDARVPALVIASIRNPTDRMRKAFAKLSNSQQELLIALLDSDPPKRDQLLSRVLTSSSEPELDIVRALDDMVGTFIISREDHIGWVHPSYRDLVIEELSHRVEWRRRFLRVGSAKGLALALSEAGGAAGERRMPLLTDLEDVEAFRAGAAILVSDAPNSFPILNLVMAIGNLLKLMDIDIAISRRLREVGEELVTAVLARWQIGSEFDVFDLKLFLGATGGLGLDRRPNVSELWIALTSALRGQFEESMPDPMDVDQWAELKALIESSYPEVAGTREFREQANEVLDLVVAAVDQVLGDSPDIDRPTNNSEQGDYLSAWAEALKTADSASQHVVIRRNLQREADEFWSYGPSEPEGSYDPTARSRTVDIDIDRLFSDL